VITTEYEAASAPERRVWWKVSAKQARAQLVLAATVTWLVSIVVTLGGTGRTSLVGVLNAPDFVQFYTLGRLADQHRIADAYDFRAFHEAQGTFVPESKALIFPPVYPPQTALLFMPLSRLSYTAAQLTWTVLTLVLYALIVWRAWWAFRGHLHDRALVFAAAAAFPPFWQNVMWGQVTILILGAFFLAWLALERGRHFAAGFALGLLAIKPQFGLVFAVVVLMRRDWRMLAGALSAVALQLALVWIAFGPAAFSGYASVVQTIAGHSEALEAKPFHSHSIRAVTRLLPDSLGIPVWLIGSAIVLWKAGRAWCTAAPLHVRCGLAILAAVLVNPHLIVYDATVLALPLLWFGAWLLERQEDEAQWYGPFLYLIFLAFWIPTAAVVKVQLSVPLMLWLFWKMERKVTLAPVVV